MDKRKIYLVTTAVLRKALRVVLPEAQLPCLADFLDRSSKLLLADAFKRWTSEIAKRTDDRCTILDVGTGGGWFPVEIARAIFDINIVAIDASPKMINIAVDNIKKEGLSDKIKFCIANAQELNFKDCHFDMVISSFSLHHWKNPIKIIDECYRVLKDQGEFWIYDLCKDNSREDLANFSRNNALLLSQAGLKYKLIFSLPFIGQHRELRIDAYTADEAVALIKKTKFKNCTITRQGLFMKIVLQKNNL